MLVFSSACLFALIAALAADSNATNDTTTEPIATSLPTPKPTKTSFPTCEPSDLCSCSLSDGLGGSGLVSLREISSVEYTGFQDSVTVTYKPCSPFTFGTNVAKSKCSAAFGSVMCEWDKNYAPFYESLATANETSFAVNPTTKRVTVKYTRPNTTNEHTYVRLICDSTVLKPTLAKTKIRNKDWYFDLTAASVCLNYSAPSSSPSPATPKCDGMDDCKQDLIIAVPVTAAGTAILSLLISCCVIKFKERKVGRYYSL